MTDTAIFQVTQTERRIALTLSLPRLRPFRRRRAEPMAARTGRPFGLAEYAYQSQRQCL